MTRKHVATGNKPPGGKRSGAGRPPGSRNTLALGEVRALKALRLRVPEATPEPLAEVADEAFDRVVDIMRGGQTDPAMASVQLRAAAMVREEVCGPVKQRVEVSYSELTDEQLEAKKREILERELLARDTVSATKPPESGE